MNFQSIAILIDDGFGCYVTDQNWIYLCWCQSGYSQCEWLLLFTGYLDWELEVCSRWWGLWLDIESIDEYCNVGFIEFLI